MTTRTISSGGTNNEENRIRDAIATLSQGDTLYLNPGTYTIQYPNEINLNGINLTSNPNNKAILKIMEWGEQRVTGGDCGTNYAYCCGQRWYPFGTAMLLASNCSINNVILDGSLGHLYLVAGQGCGNLLYCRGSVDVDSVIFRNCINDAVALDRGYNNVHNCVFERITHECIAIGRSFGIARQTTVNDLIENNFIDSSPGNVECIPWHSPTGSPLGTGSICWHNSFVRFENCDGTIVRNNTNVGMNQQIPYEFCPQNSTDIIRNILIENNLIQNTTTDAGVCFLLDAGGSGVNRSTIRIINNAFVNNQGWGGAIGSRDGSGWNDIEVSGNTFATNNRYGAAFHQVNTNIGVNFHDNVYSNIIPPGVGYQEGCRPRFMLNITQV